MNVIASDPKGYYSVLGLSPGADLATIKTAYRARVKSVHPDRNGSSRAREEFQRLVEAYAVLKDMVTRSEYDTTGEAETTAATQPYCCCDCGRVTAQPRYLVLRKVRSYLVWAKIDRVQGIFCRGCADRAAVKASTATWALGWWSLPGLLLTPLVLLINLLGGTLPPRENARLLIRQAHAFLALGEDEIAAALAGQAIPFAREPLLKRQLDQLLAALPEQPQSRRLKNRWRPSGGVFMAQLLPLLALPAVLGVFALIAVRPWEKPVSTTAAITVKAAVVGEIRHVAVEDLKVRAAPQDGSPVLTLLDRFATVEVTGSGDDPEWAEIRTAAGVSGYVQTRALYSGSGSRFKKEWCASNRGATPQGGEVLTRRVSGDHRLLVHNDGRRDGLVKLKTLTGNTVMAFYVPATYHITAMGIPEGTYRMEFATGSRYSRGCGIFLDDMQAALLPVTLTFRHLSPTASRALTRIPEISLTTAPGDPAIPQPLETDRFAADD